MRSGRDRALFWRQLAMLVEQGVPILLALDTLRTQLRQTGDREGTRVVDALALDLNRGRQFSDAMRQDFPPVERSMVRVGEETGGFVACLRRLAEWQERDLELSQRTRKALTYPLFVVVVAGGLTLLLMGTVLPAFVPVLRDLGVPLPFLTRVVLALSQACQQVWPVLGVGLGLGASTFLLHRYAATEAGLRQLYRLLLAVPVLGRVVESAALARYCETLAMLLEAGTDLLGAVQLAARASGSPLLREDAPHLMEAMRDGERLTSYMTAHQELYPPSLTRLLAAGEESHNIRRFLRAGAQTMALESELLLDMLTALLEPLLITLVAVIVGTLVLAVLLPVYGSLQGL